MLFISRQSVSSWENDRTQPDLEMLGKLSEIFGVSVEELVYGKKRNISLETQKPDHNSTLIIVFSILGTLLAGSGLVLIFITFWQKMPLLIKAVLSLLPLVAGQGAGLFVLIKKRDRISWCEGAGVLWCAGIAATLTMFYNIFGIGFYWQSMLIIQSILMLPVLFLLKCVSPVIVYYAATIVWFLSSGSYGFESIYPALGLTVVLLGIGCFFTGNMVKTEKKSLRSLCSHWISVTAVAAFSIILALEFSGDLILPVAVSGALGICLLLLSLKETDMVMPYRIPGLALTSFMLFGGSAYYHGGLDKEAENIIFLAVSAAAVVAVFLYILITKTKSKDKFFNSYIYVSLAALLVFSVVLFFMPNGRNGNHDEIFTTVMKIIAIGANILLMISGAKGRKLLPINTGFVFVSALTFLIVAQSGFSMIINGLLLLVCGGVLLLINYRLSKKSAKAPVPENSEEVQEND